MLEIVCDVFESYVNTRRCLHPETIGGVNNPHLKNLACEAPTYAWHIIDTADVSTDIKNRYKNNRNISVSEADTDECGHVCGVPVN